MGNGYVHRADHGITCIPKSLLKDKTLDYTLKGTLCTLIYLLENTELSSVNEFSEELGCSADQYVQYINLLNNYGKYAHIE